MRTHWRGILTTDELGRKLDSVRLDDLGAWLIKGNADLVDLTARFAAEPGSYDDLVAYLRAHA